MTVIIGSIFLPYTVKFEVSPQNEDLVETELEVESAINAFDPRKSSHAGTASDIASSILPSLSNTNPATSSSAVSAPTKNENDSVEDFFTGQSSASEPFFEKRRPSLVVPQSRFSKSAIDGRVVESRKKSQDGLPGVRIRRSSSNAMQQKSRPRRSFDAAHSAPVELPGSYSEEIGSKDELPSGEGIVFNQSYMSSGDMCSTGSAAMYDEDLCPGKLAPYGGFSRSNLEDVLLDEYNIFESAPWKIVKSDKGNGSLINAVTLASQKNKIEKAKWVGTMSSPSDAIPQNVLEDIFTSLRDEYDCVPVSIDDMNFSGCYKSFCKQILWPTLHYQIPDDPKSKAFEDHSYRFYKKVNQLVADKIVEAYQAENEGADPEDENNAIWIHDYHLLLVPQMVREKLPDAKIGFFLHVSFPSSEVFRCLAQRTALLKGLLGADCITFQNEEYGRHFSQTCYRLLLSDSNEIGVIYNNKLTAVKAIPLGIDAPKLKEILSSPAVADWTKSICQKWQNQTLIVSRDKLEKLRGVKQKLLAYEKYLNRYPEKIKTTVLIQIFRGSAGDADYEAEVMQIISRINGMAADISSAQPVVILHHDIDFVQYAALQIQADVFIVASMREGLNLTCHEFIVANSRKKSPLIISEFAGSSSLLDCEGEGALLINPWDVESFSKAIARALTMSEKEKKSRWEKCYEIVLKHDSLDWVTECLKATNEAWKHNIRLTSTNCKTLTKAKFERFYTGAHGKRLIIINIDDLGSSGVIGHSRSSEVSRVGSLLSNILEDENNHVLFSSMMKRSELDQIFKNKPRIGLMAEFGGYIRLPGKDKWISINKEDQRKYWMPQVARVFDSKAERLPGSKVVVNDCSLELIAQTSMVQDPKRSLDVMGECISFINESFDKAEGLHVSIIHNSVVVQQRNISIGAMRFLVSYYSKALSPEKLTAQFKLQRVSSSRDISNKAMTAESSGIHSPNEGRMIDQIFFAGGLNPIDENIYEYISSLKASGMLSAALTVAVRDGIQEGRTSADYSTVGQHELISILAREEDRSEK